MKYVKKYMRNYHKNSIKIYYMLYSKACNVICQQQIFIEDLGNENSKVRNSTQVAQRSLHTDHEIMVSLIEVLHRALCHMLFLFFLSNVSPSLSN